MSLPVFRAPDLDPATLAVGQQVLLQGPEGRHAVTVTRLQVGERLQLSNGRGMKATGTVTQLSGKDGLQMQVEELSHAAAPTPRVTIVQSLPKSERSELAVELATEAGADAIIPFAAQRCVAKWVGAKQTKGQQKWQQAALKAAKQSRRAIDPVITPLHDLPQLLAAITQCCEVGGQVLVLHEAAATPFAATVTPQAPELMLLIGPEGGFSEAEVDAFTAAGAHPVLLGPEVYRTSTAAAVALGALGVLTSRWQHPTG